MLVHTKTFILDVTENPVGHYTKKQ